MVHIQCFSFATGMAIMSITNLYKTLQKSPDFIKTGDVAIVKVKPTRAIVVEKFSEFPQLGRFAIRDMGQTVAAGVVLDVVKKAV